MPLVHRPGRGAGGLRPRAGQAGRGAAQGGLLRDGLPYSDALFVQVFERIVHGDVLGGPRRAFAFFGGVPVADQLRQRQGPGGQGARRPRPRKLTDGFLQLAEPLPVRPRTSAGCAGPTRRGWSRGWCGTRGCNFLVPVPQVRGPERAQRPAGRAVPRRTGAAGCGASGRTQGGAASARTGRRSCRCRRPPSMPAARSRPRPAPCRWCASTATTTRCRCATPIIRWWSKGYVDRVEICHRDERIADAPAAVGQGGRLLRPRALPGAAGAQARGAGPRPALRGLGAARVLRRAAPAAGGRDGRRGDAGVHPGAAAAGEAPLRALSRGRREGRCGSTR